MKDTDKAYLYKHFGENDELLYIGITDNISRRFRQHAKNARWFDLIRKMTYEECGSYQIAVEKEVTQIQELKPIFNIIHNRGRFEPIIMDAPSTHDSAKAEADILEKESALQSMARKAINPMFVIIYAISVMGVLVALNALENEHHDFMEYKYNVEHGIIKGGMK